MPQDTREGTGIITSPNFVSPEETLALLEDFDGSTFLIEVEIEVESINGATPAASRWIAGINATFGPGLRHGVTSVRNIAGTNTPSQHSYGNAVDTFASESVMNDFFYYGISNARLYSIRLLIFHGLQYYGRVISGYGGIYHNHVHADFWPQYPL